MKHVVFALCLACSQAFLGADEPSAPKLEGESQTATNKVEASAIQIRTVQKSSFSGIRTPLKVVIDDQEAWSEFWSKHTATMKPAPALPIVDFSTEVVLAVGLGRKNTGGYAIEITEVRPKGKRLEVIVQERTPPDRAMTIQSLTAPIHMVAIPVEEGQKPRFVWTVRKDRKHPGLSNKRKID
ncbi:MAG: protease complex subunit PrcB family protein [Verrucomicrobiales bacterium]